MVCLAPVGRLPIFRQIIICDNDDYDVGILGFYFLCKLEAVFPRQSQVRKDGIGWKHLDFL